MKTINFIVAVKNCGIGFDYIFRPIGNNVLLDVVRVHHSPFNLSSAECEKLIRGHYGTQDNKQISYTFQFI